MLQIIYAVVVTFALTIPGEELPKGETVLDNYVKATGGMKNYDRIKNRVTESTMEFKGQGVKIDLLSYAAKPDKTFIILESDLIGKKESGTWEGVAWEVSKMTGPMIQEGAMKDFLLRESVFDKFVYWRKIFKKAECLALEEVNKRPCYKVKMTPKGKKTASPVFYYFDKESRFLTKVSLRIKTPMGEMPVDSYLSDYRDTDGIKISHKMVLEMMGQKREVITKSIKQNVKLPEDRFDPPKEIKELIKAQKSTEDAAAK